MKNTVKIIILVSILMLGLGIFIGTSFLGTNQVGNTTVSQTKETIWTCSMHPQIRKTEAGKCPICGMELIPLNEDIQEHSTAINMSPTAMQLANVQTSIVEKQTVTKEISVTGKVKADERNVISQSSHFKGRIERLIINYTGEFIKKGQVIAYIYAPELIKAQEELFQAWKMKESQAQLYQAARKKMLNLKLTNKQIDAILEKGSPQEKFPILADVSGSILTKKVALGDYVQKGQSLFEIVDLSKVWVLFDLYERDLTWVKVGDSVQFTVQSLAGKEFKGKITFIDPVLNPQTRVASARIEMANSLDLLKPNMFVSGDIQSQLYGVEKRIVVPKTAVMWTGQRSLVYLKQATSTNFEMREVVLGESLGKSYVIKKGLQEGEEIVTNGTFNIDAAAQLAGKPSMMNEKEPITKTAFKVWGNCSMCKKTIESALTSNMGITFDEWNQETKQMTVMFDSSKISLEEIHQKISATGYDTEQKRGDNQVYEQLHECCQYQRK